MLSIDRILFPTDGSACAAQAHRYAVDLADRYHATLHVLHVDERSARHQATTADAPDRDAPADSEETFSLPPDASTTTHTEQHVLTHPSPPQGILMHAAEHDIDLIVMGTHGRRGIARAVIGSVAEEVVRRSECPVFTVRAQETGVSVPHFDHVLVPVDFSEHMPALLHHAGCLAEDYDVPVHLLHVVEQIVLPTAYGIQPPDVDQTGMRKAARDVLAEYRAGLEARGLEAHALLRNGHPARQILRTVESASGAPLVMLSTHGRTGVQRLLLGSVAENVIRRSIRPVFVVKAFGRSLVADTFASSADPSSADPST